MMKEVRGRSPAADGDDDLDTISRFDECFGMAALGYDFPVLLDGESLAGQAKLFEKIGDAGAGIALARFTVEGEFNHWSNR